MNLPAKSELYEAPERVFGVVEGKSGEEMIIAGLKVMVVGLGSTGMSASRFLARSGASVRATDLRSAEDIDGIDELETLGVIVEAGGHDLSCSEKVDLVVVSPGVPGDIPLLKAKRAMGVEIISEVELASRFITAPIVAVAGTNGKTTTATLIGEMLRKGGLKCFVGGNIGTPAIDSVEGDKDLDACVLEVSSFQLEAVTSFSPRVAVLLNITEDHLYRYRDFDDYADTKMNLFKYQDGKDYAVVNGSDTEASRRVTRAVLTGRLFPFALRGRTTVGDAAFIEDGEIVLRFDGNEERYGATHIKELTNLDNAMAAVVAARLMGAPRSAVRHVLDTFSPLPHRVELIKEAGGVTFINDSKATNVGATLTALIATEVPIVLIAGGVDKGGDYQTLAPLLSEKVRLMVVTGEGGAKMKDALSGNTEIISADNFDEAVKIAISKAKENETVLLSPACSSFDEFSSFAERGERFRSIVEGMEEL